METNQIIDLQDNATKTWHEGGEVAKSDLLLAKALSLHQLNFELWHQEDFARIDFRIGVGARLEQEPDDLRVPSRRCFR